MDAETLNILKSKLPRNYVAILHQRTGFSKGYISEVLNPESKKTCDKIEDAAIALAKETVDASKNKVEQVKMLVA